MEPKTYVRVKSSMITFGNRVNAFLAVPEHGTGPFPAMIMCHERYGLVEHTIDLAAKWAQFGFVGIAPDLFSRWDGDKDALNRGDVQVPITDDEIKGYLGETLDYLLADPLVNPQQIGVMGVCQSGEFPLVLNSVRPEVAANIVVYGGAGSRVWDVGPVRREPYMDILKRVTAPILGIWGEDDFVVSVPDVLRLRNALEELNKTYEFTLYRDMPHGWFNDTMPGRYRPRETAHAWGLIMDFLDRVFAGEFPKDRVFWKFESDIAVDYDFTKKVRWA